ncbi:hypothetical protein LH23_03880 [Cedecea neteri]|uniref:Uncharacterized protein n=1 Tax=Cedecea neteri TaxID=158822 RepID=A0AAN0S2G5_9ENTR|nr:hypothetical protein LH23_03880 [Cedecea neteri]
MKSASLFSSLSLGEREPNGEICELFFLPLLGGEGTEWLNLGAFFPPSPLWGEGRGEGLI